MIATGIQIKRIKDDTGKVRQIVTAASDRAMQNLTNDAAQLIRAMIRDATSGSPRSTGKLLSSVTPVKRGVLQYSIETPGVPYAAKQEWGWNPRGTQSDIMRRGRRRKRAGRYLYFMRGYFGMARRYMRGERWRP